MAGREKLQNELQAIRKSISRFEKELAEGADRIERDNDDKFRQIQEKMKYLSQRLDENEMNTKNQLAAAEEHQRAHIVANAATFVELFEKSVKEILVSGVCCAHLQST